MLLLPLFIFLATFVDAAKRAFSGKDKTKRTVRQRTLGELSAPAKILTPEDKLTLAIKKKDLKTLKQVLDEEDVTVTPNMIASACDCYHSSVDCLKILTDTKYLLDGKFDPTLIDTALLGPIVLNSFKSAHAMLLLNFIVSSDDLNGLTLASVGKGSFVVTMRLLEISGFNPDLIIECFKACFSDFRRSSNIILACLLYQKLPSGVLFEDESITTFMEGYEAMKIMAADADLKDCKSADFLIAFACNRLDILEQLVKKYPLKTPMPYLVDIMVYSGQAHQVGKILECKFSSLKTEAKVPRAAKFNKLNLTLVGLADQGEWIRAANILQGLPKNTREGWLKVKKSDRRVQVGLRLIIKLQNALARKDRLSLLARILSVLTIFTELHPEEFALVESAWSLVFNCDAHEHWLKLIDTALFKAQSEASSQMEVEDMDTEDETLYEDLTPKDDDVISANPRVQSDCLFDRSESDSEEGLP